MTAALVEKTHRSWDELDLLDNFRRKLLLGYKMPAARTEVDVEGQLMAFRRMVGR